MNFDFATAARIVFGPGCGRSLGAEAAALGRRAFVLVGSRPERSMPLLRELERHHVMHTEFRVEREPTTGMILEALDLARKAEINLVIGIGGGSVLDSGKAIAALVANNGNLMDYLEMIGAGRPLERISAPYIAVPTTAGTGAEVTRNAVLESPSHRVKVSLRSPFMLPRLALVDPELTYSMPPALTAATGLDALTQLLEAFVSRRASPLTDGICREGLRHVARSLTAAFRDGANHRARQDMCVASLCGGLALANARLGAVHGIAGPFGGMFKAPHGAVCGRLLPFVTAANIAAIMKRAAGSRALSRYREAAGILTAKPGAAAEDGVAWLWNVCADLQVPSLNAYGLTEAHYPDLIANCLRSTSMGGNPIDLSEAELQTILSQAM